MIDTEKLIRTYRGWDSLERPHGVEIIDFDLLTGILVEIKGEVFNSRQEVMQRLIELRDSTVPETPDEEFLKARLNASIYYLRALLGEKIPFSEYAENILGIRPEIIPEEEIERQKNFLDSLLAEFGVPTKISFQEFALEKKLRKENAGIETKKAEETFMPLVLSALGLEGLEIPYLIRFVEEEAYWMGWTRTLPDGKFELRYNFHPIHQWYQGDVEFLTLHEVAGHFVQAFLTRRTIEKGELNPAIGITTVHDPHSFGAEGIANAISDFLPEVKLSPLGVLAKEHRVLRDYLQNNAHIWVNEGGDPKKLTAYILGRHPFSTEAKVRMNLENWVNNPLLRAYQYSYGISSYYHRHWNEKLSLEAKKAYLRYAYTRHATPQQLMKFVEQLK